jgi:hypothetical protein
MSRFYLDKPVTFWDEYLYSSIVDDSVDVSCYKNFFADRYGGEGILRHGGSGRCGALNSFQMKGVGPTPLVGSYLFGNYHDGKYKLLDALQEVFYDNILNRLRTAGQPACHAIFTRDCVNFDNSQDVILIKDFPYRLAHFISAPYFKPSKSFCGVKDTERTRITIKKLHKISEFVLGCKFDTIDDLIKTVAKFHGENLAILRTLMIAHGSISPSNLTINGKFIDLSCTTFWLKRLGNYSRYLSHHYEEIMKTKKSLGEFEFALRKYLPGKISNEYLVDKVFDTSYIDSLINFTAGNASEYTESQKSSFHEHFTKNQCDFFDSGVVNLNLKGFDQLRQAKTAILDCAANFHTSPSIFSKFEKSIADLNFLNIEGMSEWRKIFIKPWV